MQNVRRDTLVVTQSSRHKYHYLVFCSLSNNLELFLPFFLFLSLTLSISSFFSISLLLFLSLTIFLSLCYSDLSSILFPFIFVYYLIYFFIFVVFTPPPIDLLLFLSPPFSHSLSFSLSHSLYTFVTLFLSIFFFVFLPPPHQSLAFSFSFILSFSLL